MKSSANMRKKKRFNLGCQTDSHLVKGKQKQSTTKIFYSNYVPFKVLGELLLLVKI